MANEIKKIETENVKMKEKLVDMQCRTMKYNLIFTGLDGQDDENCENKLRHFIYQEMKIPERIEFGNIHRFGKKNKCRTTTSHHCSISVLFRFRQS